MSRKIRRLGFLLLPAIWVISGILANYAAGQGPDEQEKLAQIESYYQAGKVDMQKSNYSSAILNFSQVIDLEQNFKLIYTSYAQDYIKRAEARIRENEEKALGEVAVSSPTANTNARAEYIIGVDDALFISVWQNKDLDQEVTVRQDGKIAVLLIGEVKAEGLSVIQLDLLLTEKFKEYIKYPEVSVTIRKIGGKKVILLGEVNKPGVYAVTGQSSILELVAMANGYTKDAVMSSVVLIRGGLQKPVGYRLDLVKAMKKGDLSQNMLLEPEDIVYIPKTFISNVNYIMTQILSPIAQGLYTTQTIHNW
jgi:protein involved in polysaccharide export with SLBB domain